MGSREVDEVEGLGAKGAEERGRAVAEEDAGAGEGGAEMVGGVVTGTATDPEVAAGLGLETADGCVGHIDAGPGFEQGDIGVAERVVGDRKNVGALVAGQHALVEQQVLGHGAGDVDAEDSALAAVVDVGLHAQPLARPVVLAPAFAHLDHGQGGFVAQTGGVGGAVAREEERVVRPHAHHFGVRGAQAQGIHPHQNLIWPTDRHRIDHRLPAHAQAVDPRAEIRPGEVGGGDGGGHGGYWGLVIGYWRLEIRDCILCAVILSF